MDEDPLAPVTGITSRSASQSTVRDPRLTHFGWAIEELNPKMKQPQLSITDSLNRLHHSQFRYII